ncbi:MAG: RDD family protein [Proteobacteria bacterium]|nr:RDD family protein [Pseudomonadota bacterium]
MFEGASLAPSPVDGPTASAAAATAATRSADAPVVYVVGIWRRAAAALIDALALLPLLLLAAWVTTWVAPRVTAQALPQRHAEIVIELLLRGDPALVALLVIFALLGTLYQVVFIAALGATPGLRLLRATVIDTFGARPSAWRVLLRCAGQALGLLLLGLGLLWAAFDAEKRGLQDWLAGTYVIRRASARGR